MTQIQTVISVPLALQGRIVVRIEGAHVGPLAVHVDLQEMVGGMSPMGHDVRHETWDDGK